MFPHLFKITWEEVRKEWFSRITRHKLSVYLLLQLQKQRERAYTNFYLSRTVQGLRSYPTYKLISQCVTVNIGRRQEILGLRKKDFLTHNKSNSWTFIEVRARSTFPPSSLEVIQRAHQGYLQMQYVLLKENCGLPFIADQGFSLSGLELCVGGDG